MSTTYTIDDVAKLATVKLADGDTVLLAPGKASETLNGISTGASNVTIRTDGAPAHVVTVTNPKAHFVSLGASAKNCLVSDVVVNSSASAVTLLKGSKNTVRNVTQIGSGPIADWAAVTDFTIADCQSTNGKLTTYGCYGGGIDGQYNNGVKASGLRVAMIGSGEHCIRQQVTNHLEISDTDMTYGSPYNGQTYNIREGDDIKLTRCTSKSSTSGVVFGPLTNPDSVDLPTGRLTNLVVDGCDFDNRSFVDFRAGVVGFVVKNTRIASQSVACANLSEPWKTRPKATGQFVNVDFVGDPAKVVPIKGDLTGVTTLDCRFNGKPWGPQSATPVVPPPTFQQLITQLRPHVDAAGLTLLDQLAALKL